jgi:hypothetical protein
MTDVGSLFDRKRVTGYTSPTEILALSGLKSGTDGVGDELATIRPGFAIPAAGGPLRAEKTRSKEGAGSCIGWTTNYAYVPFSGRMPSATYGDGGTLIRFHVVAEASL